MKGKNSICLNDIGEYSSKTEVYPIRLLFQYILLPSLLVGGEMGQYIS